MEQHLSPEPYGLYKQHRMKECDHCYTRHTATGHANNTTLVTMLQDAAQACDVQGIVYMVKHVCSGKNG